MNDLENVALTSPEQLIPELPTPAIRKSGVHTYLYHCKKCGWHMDCADKQQLADIKKHHKIRGCEWGFVLLKNGQKIWVRDEIAHDVRKYLDSIPSTEK